MGSTAYVRPLDRLLLFNLATDADHPILGFTTAWVRALADVAGEVDILTMWAGRLELPANVHVYSVGKELGRNEAMRAVAFYRHLHRLLQANRYDACFAHMMPLFAVMGAPLLRRHRVPITMWYTHSATSRVLRLAERVVDRVVTAGDDTFKVPSTKVHPLGQGIDLDLFRPARSGRDGREPFTVVAAGRVTPIKRIDVMIDALAQLVAGSSTDARLRIVGPMEGSDREYVDRLRERASTLGVLDRVEFTGPVLQAGLAQEYGRADVAVNLSPSGLFDKAALEAMACGLPLVTSNPALSGEVTGIDPALAIAEPDATLLAGALRHVQRLSPDQRRALDEALRLKMADHSLTTLAERLLRVMPRRANDRAAPPVPATRF